MEIIRGYTKDIGKSISDMRNHYKKVASYEWSPFVTLKVLEFFNRFKECSHYEYSFCCNGNEYPCWVDVEGQDFGWMFLDFEHGDVEGIRKALLRDMISIVDDSKYEDCKIIIGENKNRAEILIVNRDGSNYTFSFNN